jgi:hypothetical protein
VPIAPGPCSPWPAVFCCDLTGESVAFTGVALEAASEVVWALSGRQFGTCTVTLYPCRDDCNQYSPLFRSSMVDWGGAQWPYPSLIDGAWYNLGCSGGCIDQCSCNVSSRFTLPQPISAIVSITIDGEVVPTGSYHVEDFLHVVRDDGLEWPHCNDGSWFVTVTFGVQVPKLGELAVGELMCEFVKACTSDSTCKLPQRVQTLTRQGVSMTLIDPEEFLDEGKTGLYLVDLFIRTVNPSGLARSASVHSPDIPRARMRT